MVSLTVYVVGAACACVPTTVPRSNAAIAHGLIGADDFFISDCLPHWTIESFESTGTRAASNWRIVRDNTAREWNRICARYRYSSTAGHTRFRGAIERTCFRPSPVHHDSARQPCGSTACGGRLRQIGEDVSEQLKYGPAHFKGHGGSGTAVVKAQEFVPVALEEAVAARTNERGIEVELRRGAVTRPACSSASCSGR